MFNKLREHLRAIFEGNRCRFRRQCGHYREASKCCNNWNERFDDPIYGKSYCPTYRKIVGLDKRIEKIRSRIRTERKQ